MRRLITAGIALAAILSLAACAGAGEAAETSQEASPPLESESADALPAEIGIVVSREGMEETINASLAVSEKGYAIYLTSDFVLVQGEDFDVVQPAPGSPVSADINMRIYSDGEPAGDAPEQVEIGGGTYTAVLYYPPEAAEGGAVLLREMAKTVREVPINN